MWQSAQVLAGNAPDRQNGQLQVACGKYNYADDGGIDASEVMQMVKVPDNARIVDVKLRSSAYAITLGVGDGDDTTGYYSALDTTNAINMSLYGGVANNAEVDEGPNNYYPGKTYTAEDTIDIIPSAAISAACTIWMFVEYIVEGGFDDET